MSFDCYDWEEYKHKRYPRGILATLEPTNTPLLDKYTPITSMGSCFAREIGGRLAYDGFNYLILEQPFREASCHWGQVVNLASMRQIFQYTFEQFKPIDRWWIYEQEEIIRDPYRCNIVYPLAHHEQLYREHLEFSRQALTTAKVIVLTLGLVETWRDRRDGVTYHRVPPRHMYDKDLHEFYLMDVVDCICELDDIAEMVGAHNPEAQVILTVSPIPLRATFRNVDPVIANSYSKATLRVAAEVAVDKHDNFHYFPSYELITQGTPLPFQADGRHVTERALDSVVELFKESYLI